MQLEATAAAASPGRSAIPEAWAQPLVRLGFVWTVLIALVWRDWADMAAQWWDASTYNHILLIPLILAWLVRSSWPELARLKPFAWLPGLGVIAAAAAVWAAGTLFGVNLVSQLGAVMLLQGAAVTVLGPKVAAGLCFLLAYMLFLVPFGDEVVPILQRITAEMAVALTHASGVPAYVDGVFIDTPAGLFEVAAACSGVKFLVAMIALGALVAHLCFTSWNRRALFMAAVAVLPILANGVRAWGTIYIAQSQGVAFAAGFDHIVYGWIFFAVVMGVLLAAAWRWFDRAPDAPLLDPVAIEASPWLSRLEQQGKLGGWQAGAAVVLPVALVAAWMDRVGPVS